MNELIIFLLFILKFNIPVSTLLADLLVVLALFDCLVSNDCALETNMDGGLVISAAVCDPYA